MKTIQVITGGDALRAIAPQPGDHRMTVRLAGAFAWRFLTAGAARSSAGGVLVGLRGPVGGIAS